LTDPSTVLNSSPGGRGVTAPANFPLDQWWEVLIPIHLHIPLYLFSDGGVPSQH
jgi:hypothetical protein